MIVPKRLATPSLPARLQAGQALALRNDLLLRIKQAWQDRQQAASWRQQGRPASALDCYDSAARALRTASPRHGWIAAQHARVEAALHPWTHDPELGPLRASAICGLLADVVSFYLESDAAMRAAINVEAFHTLASATRVLRGEEAAVALMAAAMAGVEADEVLSRCAEQIDTVRPHKRAPLYAQAAWTALVTTGDLDRAVHYAHASLVSSTEVPVDRTQAHLTLGLAGLLQGDLRMVDSAAAALDADSPQVAGLHHALSAASAYYQGLLTDSERHLRAMRKAWPEPIPVSDRVLRGAAAAIEAMLHREEEQFDTAAERLSDAAADLASANQTPFLQAWVLQLQCETHLDLGHGPQWVATDSLSTYVQGQSHRLAARLAAAGGRQEEALRGFAAALECFDEASPLEAARTHVLRGQWRERWGLPQAQEDYRLAAALLAPLQLTVAELRVFDRLR